MWDSNWHAYCKKIIVFLIKKKGAAWTCWYSIQFCDVCAPFYFQQRLLWCFMLVFRLQRKGKGWVAAVLGKGKTLVTVCSLNERLIQQAGKGALHFFWGLKVSNLWMILKSMTVLHLQYYCSETGQNRSDSSISDHQKSLHHRVLSITLIVLPSIHPSLHSSILNSSLLCWSSSCQLTICGNLSLWLCLTGYTHKRMCVSVWGKGGGCMSRLSRAADSCYRLDAYRGTQASHDGSHSAHAVPTRAVTAPRKTDGGSVNGK